MNADFLIMTRNKTIYVSGIEATWSMFNKIGREYERDYVLMVDTNTGEVVFSKNEDMIYRR